MRLILTRHGETVENKMGRIMGHLPGKLSDLGIEQAKRLARRLKSEKIDYIYSSDLARAADTAREIAKFHPHVPIVYVDVLREKHMGEHQGRLKSELGFGTKDSLSKIVAPGGESNKEMYGRAERFLDKILRKHKDESVLLVCHNTIGKAVIAVITKRPYTEVDSVVSLHNTSMSVFEIDKDRSHKIHLLNCVKHLE
jgi:broad specificity phosphatase PhoE